MPDNITLLHLSDLHLSLNNSDQDVVLKAFLQDIDLVKNTPLKPSVVLFTGDLVKDGDDLDSYFRALDYLILPLVERLGLSTDDIIITPGNHDARRSIIERSSDWHKETQKLRRREDLNDFYRKHAAGPVLADKFANFSAFEQTIGNKSRLTSNGLFSTFHHKRFDLSIASFNSAWMTFGGLQENEKGRLAIPELAVSEALASLPETKSKLVLTHHPLSWLSDENAGDFKRSSPKEGVHLFGHVHDPEPSQQLSGRGQMLSCQSGALFTKRSAYNGYSIVSISGDRSHARVNYRSYFDKRRRFDVATDVMPEGVFYSSPKSEAYWKAEPSQISRESVRSWIAAEVAPAIRATLIDSLTDRPVHQIFVFPTLLSTPDLGEDPDATGTASDEAVSWLDFVVSTDNHLIRGRPEYGKSTVLKQLCHELTSPTAIREIQRLPILLSFSDVQGTVGKLLGTMRGSIPEAPNGLFTFKQLAEDGYLCLLMDDVNFQDAERMKVLTAFMREYPRIRYILTTQFDPVEMVGRVRGGEFPVATKSLYLDQIGRGRMRQLVRNLHTDEPLQQEVLLNRILHDLRSMNVPITAVNGAILLTIFRSEKSFVPINRSIVLDRFIDILLKRYALEEARRSTFDFRNKTHLLSRVARWMCETSVYDPEYEHFYEFVRTYMHDRGLKYGAEKIIAELISCRVLATRANKVLFRYRSFLEFFVARAMEEDKTFRDWVLEEERYLGYVNEIEYYSGLDRNDAPVLELVGQRFSTLSAVIRGVYEGRLDLSLLDKTPLPVVRQGEDGYALVQRQLRLPRLTEKERDDILESEIPREVLKEELFNQDVERPWYENDAQRWLVSLMLYSRVLRNMELVDRNTKISALKTIFKGWAEFLLVYFTSIPSLAHHRSLIVNGVKYEVIAPDGYNEGKLKRYLMMNAPRLMSGLVFEFAGSEKLHGVLEDDDFKEETLIEKFFRKALYIDLRLPEFLRVLSTLHDDLNKAPFLGEALIWKMQYMYRRIFLTETENESFRKLLAKSVAHRFGAKGRRASEREAEEVQRLERRHLVDLMRRKNEDKGG